MIGVKHRTPRRAGAGSRAEARENFTASRATTAEFNNTAY